MLAVDLRDGNDYIIIYRVAGVSDGILGKPTRGEERGKQRVCAITTAVDVEQQELNIDCSGRRLGRRPRTRALT
jgi:hypothetical protein